MKNVSGLTYEQWLRLSDDERHTVHFHQWDLHARDGYTIAITAANTR